MSRRHMIWVAIAVAPFAMLLVAGYSAIAFHHWISLSFISRITGVEFPPGISNVTIYDNTEYVVVAHVHVPNDQVAAFVQLNDFEKIEDRQELKDRIAQVSRFAPSLFDARFRDVPMTANWNKLGRTESNTWLFQLDRATGDLWIEVMYPDRGGDPP